MFDAFRKYLEDKTSMSEKDYELIESVSVVKKLRKRQYLLQKGDIWPYHVFVCDGLLRCYRVDDKGDEHIIFFSMKNWWAGDTESTISGNPSNNNIEAIEDSVVLLIKDGDFEMLKSKIPVFRDFINTLITKSLIAFQDRVHSDISLTAEERYLHYIDKYPQIALRVPQHMLASYLGVSTETLSRIRNSISRK
jgi:CRP-like cAMP-binding protein